jgi:hypothetical protein
MSKGEPARFGWCLDDLHDECMEWFTNSDRRCACTCHNSREMKVDSTMIQQYPQVEVAGTTSTSTDTTSTSSKVDARAIRAWAKAQGIEVGARGRIKPDLIARYNEAHH